MAAHTLSVIRTRLPAGNTPRSEHKIVPHVPPIYIKNISDFSASNDDLIKITNPNRLTCKSTPWRQIVRPNGHFSFNNIVVRFDKTNASCRHTFISRPMRPFKMVISNLHHSTLSADISPILSREDYTFKQVHDLKNKTIVHYHYFS